MLVAAETSQHDNMDKERSYSKPWYARKIVLGGMEWPFTPVSVIGFFLIIYNVVRILTYAHSANASHILLTTDDAKTTLSKLKAEIGNDGDKFAKAAKDLSKCPSSRNGGNFGRVTWRRRLIEPCLIRTMTSRRLWGLSKLHLGGI